MDETIGESELLQASAAGDKEAFGVIVGRYQALVCAVTYSATGDVGVSEELAQETFIRAWKNLKQLESPAKFRAWLCSIARNLTRTSIRTRRKTEHSLGEGAVLPASAPSPEEIASEKEREQLVWGTVGKIDPKYREPLVLYYRRGQSIGEVAADLELTEDAVRQRLYRGRQLIKSGLSSLVEDTLTRSGPGKTFAVAVVAALPALITPPASAAVVGIAAKGAPAAKTVWAAGLTGAVLGPILGLLGGLFGAWSSVRNTGSPRERRFMIRMVVLLWGLIVALVGVPLTLVLAELAPTWVGRLGLAVFFASLLPLIVWGNRRQRRIQIEDGTYREPDDVVSLSTSGIYGSFAGSILGATLWLLILAGLAGDWRAFAVIICGDVSIFFGATVFCVRDRQRYWLAAIWAVFGVMAVTLVAVNLCWVGWMAAYRLSWAYDARNDVSLRTINMVVVGAFVVIIALFVTRYIRQRKRRKDRDTHSDQ